MNNRVKGLLTVFSIVLLICLMGYLAYRGVDYNGAHYLSFKNIKQGLDLKGGVYIVYDAENPTPDDMKKAESIIRLRLDSKNYTEATVSIQGENRLRVEIPDVDDADEAVNDIGKTAVLQFVDEAGNVVVQGADVVDAAYQEYSDMEGTTQVRKPGVNVTFSKEGTEKFSQATAENIGKRILIMLDGEIISAPVVQQRIDSSTCSITGDFTMDSADYLATLIKSGALPVPLNVIEVNRVGAQLGADALDGSMKAAVAATLIILLFMLVYYRISGVAADIALMFFVTAELLVLSIFRITLTLPGIAGMILTVGMAVDANVIIFERMKEDLKNGKTIRTAIESGHLRALPAILDGNITTLIAAVILYVLGTGPIKGFAQTLILGVAISMFTAIFVTRALLSAFYKIGLNNSAMYGQIKDNFLSRIDIKVVKNRRMFYGISLALITITVLFGVYRGVSTGSVFNFDVDFSGGTSLHYNLKEDFSDTDVEKIITDATGLQSPVVQRVIGTDEVTVKILRINAEQRDSITEALIVKYPQAEILSFSDVSSTVSAEMQQKALMAVFVACVSMLIYITVRFKDVKMGTSAIAALLHDLVIVIGVYIIFVVPVNNSFIAAVLTILGYSINATIVVFDRIRENRKYIKRHELEKLIDVSINQTLSRSINTSLTTLVAIACVYVFGVNSVREFAFPLIIGILSGAYSSVFFAGSVWYALCAKFAKR